MSKQVQMVDDAIAAIQKLQLDKAELVVTLTRLHSAIFEHTLQHSGECGVQAFNRLMQTMSETRTLLRHMGAQ